MYSKTTRTKNEELHSKYSIPRCTRDPLLRRRGADFIVLALSSYLTDQTTWSNKL